MVSSPVDFATVPTWKTRRQNQKIFSQFYESDTDFMIAQNNYDAPTENRTNTAEENITSICTKNPTQVNDSQLYVHTLERSVVNKVRSEVENVITTIETKVRDAILTAIESLVVPGVELAIKSVNAFYGRDVSSVVPDPNQKEFPGNIEGLQMTASSRINSITELNKIDETRGNITNESGDLSINGKDFDRQTRTHHRHEIEMLYKLNGAKGISREVKKLFKKKRLSTFESVLDKTVVVSMDASEQIAW